MTEEEKEKEQFLLEARKVKALEKIAASMDSLTVWFEEINKKDWGDRIQYYLSEFYKIANGEIPEVKNGKKKS